MQVGIIGAGRIGTALAGHFLGAGHPVMLANGREPASLAPLVEQLGANASAGTSQQAADFGDVVAFCVPWDHREAGAAGVSDWTGRLVIDPTNPLREVKGSIEVVDTGDRTSSEIVADLLPGAHLVKGFGTYFANVLAEDPAVDGGRRVILLAGDDLDAKQKVGGLADSAGFAAIDVGPLVEGGALFQMGGKIRDIPMVERGR